MLIMILSGKNSDHPWENFMIFICFSTLDVDECLILANLSIYEFSAHDSVSLFKEIHELLDNYYSPNLCDDVWLDTEFKKEKMIFETYSPKQAMDIYVAIL